MIKFKYNDVPSFKELASLTTPVWLSYELVDFLYKGLRAIFERRQDVAQSYRWKTERQIRTYLGTYWPKTFAEVFAVFSSYIKMGDFVNKFEEKDKISILDLGGNSLPASIALLFVLKKAGVSLKKVEIFVLDRNLQPVKYGKQILNRFFKDIQIKIYITEKDFNSFFTRHFSLQKNFDFILCSKMGNELYSQGNVSCYKQIISYAEKRLNKNGVFYLSDVTMPINSYSKTFFPMVMNSQIARYLRKNGGLKPVFPVPCGFHGSTCKVRDCFTQVVLNIDTSKPNYPFKAKFSPKLFLHRENAEQFLQKHFNPNDSYTIANTSRYGLKVCENKK